MWDALPRREAILAKIRRAIAEKLRRNGEPPAGRFEYGPEDIARYEAAIDELSADDLDDTARHRPLRSSSSPDTVAANPGDWASRKVFDLSKFVADDRSAAPSGSTRGHHRESSSGSEPPKKRSRMARTLPPPPTQSRGLPRAYAFREPNSSSCEGTATDKDSDYGGNDSDGNYNSEERGGIVSGWREDGDKDGDHEDREEGNDTGSEEHEDGSDVMIQSGSRWGSVTFAD